MVAIDSGGNIYGVDLISKRVPKLDTGSSSQSVLPFTDLNAPSGVAVDSPGQRVRHRLGQHSIIEVAGELTDTHSWSHSLCARDFKIVRCNLAESSAVRTPSPSYASTQMARSCPSGR